ncbi:hypothetical protein LBMAG41_20580 [Cyanobium sp.]|nr:hypothetical protein LBMAG41_20580 [Cyanobium sp.]
MDEAWNRWDGVPDGRPEQASDDGALRLNRRSGSFREPPGIASSRNRAAAAPRDGRRPGRDGPEPLDQRLDRWVSRGRELVDGVAGARPGSRTPGPEAAGLGHRGLGAGGLNPARLGRWVEERFDWLLEDDADDDWREPWQEPARGSGRRPTGAPEARRPERPSDSWAAPPSGSPSPRRSDPQPRPWEASVASERRSLEAVSRRPSRTAPPGSAPPPSLGRANLRTDPGTLSAPTAQGSAAIGDPAANTSGGAGAAPDGSEAWPDDATFTLQRWQRTPPSPGPAPLAADPPAARAAAPGRPLPRSSRRR